MIARTHRGFNPQNSPARSASGGSTFLKTILPSHYLNRTRAIALDLGNIRDASADRDDQLSLLDLAEVAA